MASKPENTENNETKRKEAVDLLHNCRILSFEGNGGLELTSTLILSEIQKRRPGFMTHGHLVLAGTSAGGMQALILATQDDPAERLEELEHLWENTPRLARNTVLRSGLAMFGLGAFGSFQGIEKYFQFAHIFRHTQIE